MCLDIQALNRKNAGGEMNKQAEYGVGDIMPITGDETNIALLLGILIAAAVALAILLILIKKRSSKQK